MVRLDLDERLRHEPIIWEMPNIRRVMLDCASLDILHGALITILGAVGHHVADPLKLLWLHLHRPRKNFQPDPEDHPADGAGNVTIWVSALFNRLASIRTAELDITDVYRFAREGLHNHGTMPEREWDSLLGHLVREQGRWPDLADLAVGSSNATSQDLATLRGLRTFCGQVRPASDGTSHTTSITTLWWRFEHFQGRNGGWTVMPKARDVALNINTTTTPDLATVCIHIYGPIDCDATMKLRFHHIAFGHWSPVSKLNLAVHRDGNMQWTDLQPLLELSSLTELTMGSSGSSGLVGFGEAALRALATSLRHLRKLAIDFEFNAPIVYGSDLCHLVNISGLEEVKGLSVGWVPEERTQTTLRRIDIWWPDESDRDEQYKGETLMDRAEWDDVVAERHTERSRAWLRQIFPNAVVSRSMRMEEDLQA